MGMRNPSPTTGKRGLCFRVNGQCTIVALNLTGDWAKRGNGETSERTNGGRYDVSTGIPGVVKYRRRSQRRFFPMRNVIHVLSWQEGQNLSAIPI